MKKSIILAVMFLFVTLSAGAQNDFNKGDKVLNLGLGLGNTIYNGNDYYSIMPALSASFEVGILDHIFDNKSSIGVGGYMGFTSAKYKDPVNDREYRWTDFIISSKGAFHYQFVENLDTYAGFLVGVKLGYDNGSSEANESSPIVREFIGARYYLTDNFAGMAEIGYGISYLNIGVALKF